MAFPILSPIITFFPATTALVHIAITVTIALWLSFTTADTALVYFKRRAAFVITSRWTWITSSTAKVRKRWLFSTVKISDTPQPCLSYWHVGFLLVEFRAKVITSFFVFTCGDAASWVVIIPFDIWIDNITPRIAITTVQKIKGLSAFRYTCDRFKTFRLARLTMRGQSYPSTFFPATTSLVNGASVGSPCAILT